MKVKKLSNISFDEILACFLKAFENYYVKMPIDSNYYKNRWKAAKVDFNLSYGMFDNDKLIGFIINAVDNRKGVLTAYNTGTGVLQEYRGKRIIKSIYDYALGDLEKNGIKKNTLEVIRENKIAIRSYESIGFKICKRYNCFGGTIKIENALPFELEKVAVENIDWKFLPNQEFYSWDFQKETILEGNYSFFKVLNNGVVESFFIINTENLYLAQFDLLNSENQGWNRLFLAIKEVSESIKIINVDDRLIDKLQNISLFGLENTVNQYEMELVKR